MHKNTGWICWLFMAWQQHDNFRETAGSLPYVQWRLNNWSNSCKSIRPSTTQFHGDYVNKNEESNKILKKRIKVEAIYFYGVSHCNAFVRTSGIESLREMIGQTRKGLSFPWPIRVLRRPPCLHENAANNTRLNPIWRPMCTMIVSLHEIGIP